MSKLTPVSQHIIENLLLGACPERATECAQFWKQFQPTFFLRRDDTGTAISARRDKVTWMQKTFVHDWVVTFAGFRALAAYVPHIVLGELLDGQISSQSLQDDAGLEQAEADLDGLLYFAKQVREISDPSELDWPADIPEPGTTPDTLADPQSKACFDLACLAAAATFLHELRHVQFFSEQNSPAAPMDEERACDDYSRTMLLEKVDAYCSGTGEPVDKVLNKRVIGLATAAFAISQADKASMASAIEDKHPPTPERFVHFVLEADAGENLTCWLYTACLLIALLRQRGRFPTQLKFVSRKDLCLQLVSLL